MAWPLVTLAWVCSFALVRDVGLCAEPVEEIAAVVRGLISRELAVGFAWNRHRQQTLLDERDDVALVVAVGVGQAHRCEQVDARGRGERVFLADKCAALCTQID